MLSKIDIFFHFTKHLPYFLNPRKATWRSFEQFSTLLLPISSESQKNRFNISHFFPIFATIYARMRRATLAANLRYVVQNISEKIMIVEILKTLFDGICVGLASSMTVGPVAVLCIQRTLSKGGLSGIMSGMGVACADTLLAILAFSVYALLKTYIDEYSTIIQICGGVFVVIVGIIIFFKNPVPQIRKNRTGHIALWQDFASMFGFTLANFVVIIPYILAFFTMFNVELAKNPSTAIADGSSISNLATNVLIISGFLLGASLWWIALTTIISFFRRGFRPRHILTINRVAGVVISALGVIALVSQFV